MSARLEDKVINGVRLTKPIRMSLRTAMRSIVSSVDAPGEIRRALISDLHYNRYELIISLLNSLGAIPVFVYGTLKRGHNNNRLLAGERFLGAGATLEAGYRMADIGPYPACYAVEDGARIIGELYMVGPETFKRLDALEGVDPKSPTSHTRRSHYHRRLVEVKIETGASMAAWMYIMEADQVSHLDTVEEKGGHANWRGRLLGKEKN